MSESLPSEPFGFIAGAMSSFSGSWFVCGGWAVDTWLGRQTRAHLDFDISIYGDEQSALHAHLEGWNIVGHGEADANPDNTLWDGRPFDLPAHLHARPPGEENLAALMRWVTPPHIADRDGHDLDFQFNERAGGHWILNAEPRVALSEDAGWLMAPNGLPTAVPEAICFYKATAYHDDPKYQGRRPHDEMDFFALLPMVRGDRRRWLEASIEAVRPGHPWLARMPS